MPEIRTYVVTQIREVEVRANSHRDALDIAHAAFHGEPSPEGIWGDTMGHVKTMNVSCARVS